MTHQGELGVDRAWGLEIRNPRGLKIFKWKFGKIKVFWAIIQKIQIFAKNILFLPTSTGCRGVRKLAQI